MRGVFLTLPQLRINIYTKIYFSRGHTKKALVQYVRRVLVEFAGYKFVLIKKKTPQSRHPRSQVQLYSIFHEPYLSIFIGYELASRVVSRRHRATEVASVRRDGCPKESSRSQFRNSRRSIEFNWIMVAWARWGGVGARKAAAPIIIHHSADYRDIPATFAFITVTQRVGRERRESDTREARKKFQERLGVSEYYTPGHDRGNLASVLSIYRTEDTRDWRRYVPQRRPLNLFSSEISSLFLNP